MFWSIGVSVSLSLRGFVCLVVGRSGRSVCQSVDLLVYRSVGQSVRWPVGLSIWGRGLVVVLRCVGLSLCRSVGLSAWLSVGTVGQSVGLSVSRSVGLLVWRTVGLSACRFLPMGSRVWFSEFLGALGLHFGSLGTSKGSILRVLGSLRAPFLMTFADPEAPGHAPGRSVCSKGGLDRFWVRFWEPNGRPREPKCLPKST